ncbi:hypothetical protein [Lysobacter sp. Root983]|uniref:hypothetical protein n=1 Tax=Lysobacter sp. Root983 TaxID=1736613 RepID=UPI00070AB1CD|nr:hypothetical protein [Lysobacter sp. Root983]KRD79872.1 hypothetical protein ASE43_02955 [Lysobacter sp. Root983]
MKRTLALIAAYALAAPAHAACLGETPLAAAQAWFRQHYTFWNEPTTTLGDAFAPPLLRLLEREQACKVEGVCAIDADPWLDAQDGEARDPEYFVEAEDVVRLRYRFVLDERMPTQSRELRLRFSGADRCWRAADLVSPDGRSLLRTLTSYYDE